jgi:hypothetical protein
MNTLEILIFILLGMMAFVLVNFSNTEKLKEFRKNQPNIFRFFQAAFILGIIFAVVLFARKYLWDVIDLGLILILAFGTIAAQFIAASELIKNRPYNIDSLGVLLYLIGSGAFGGVFFWVLLPNQIGFLTIISYAFISTAIVLGICYWVSKGEKQPKSSDLTSSQHKEVMNSSLLFAPDNERFDSIEKIVANLNWLYGYKGGVGRYKVMLPIPKSYLPKMFPTHFDPKDYTNFVELVIDKIHPDRWASKNPFDWGDLYRIFDRNGDYILSWSRKSGAHIEKDPRIRFYQLHPDVVEEIIALDGAEIDLLRSLLRTDAGSTGSNQLETINCAIDAYIDFHEQEGGIDDARAFLLLKQITTSAKTIYDLEKIVTPDKAKLEDPNPCN